MGFSLVFFYINVKFEYTIYVCTVHGKYINIFCLSELLVTLSSLYWLIIHFYGDTIPGTRQPCPSDLFIKAYTITGTVLKHILQAGKTRDCSGKFGEVHSSESQLTVQHNNTSEACRNNIVGLTLNEELAFDIPRGIMKHCCYLLSPGTSEMSFFIECEPNNALLLLLLVLYHIVLIRGIEKV